MNKIIKISKTIALKSQMPNKCFKFSSGQSDLLRASNEIQNQIKLPQQNNIIKIFNQVLNFQKGQQRNAFQYSTVNNNKKENQVLLKSNSEKNEIKSQNQQKLINQLLKAQPSNDEKLSLKTDGVKNENQKKQKKDNQQQNEEFQKNKQSKNYVLFLQFQNNETDKRLQQFFLILNQVNKKTSWLVWVGRGGIGVLIYICWQLFSFYQNSKQNQKQMKILKQTQDIQNEQLKRQNQSNSMQEERSFLKKIQQAQKNIPNFSKSNRNK